MKNLTASKGQPQTSPILYLSKYTSNTVRVMASIRATFICRVRVGIRIRDKVR